MSNAVKFIVGVVILNRVRPGHHADRIKLPNTIVAAQPQITLLVGIHGVNIVVG
jgi:hypothetical protein